MQKNISTASKVWHGTKFFIKWFWLIAMFLLGVSLLLVMPLIMFEYSFSLSELDLIETLFIVFLVVFIYQYGKRCRQIDAPLVRKIITPWVHQAHIFLVFYSLTLISAPLLELNLRELERMALLDLFGYILMAGTFGYSYYRIGLFAKKTVETVEVITTEGAVE
ncbi:hypothetical protein [Aliivibrio fischeri]|uniref:hypothetical protein n=1 Tax=Aliivibrio fischeri TaxID=668 RepID=UPI000AF6EC73|nr:hypothetical protein [Aliivibrio fischeri]